MKNKVIIIGASNIDIVAISKNKIKKTDSNPGIVEISYGGVGRNIAENASRLIDNLGLISVIGKDSNGINLIKHANKCGIDLSHSIFLEDEITDTYIAIMDSDSTMNVSVADMKLISRITKDELKKHIDYLKEAKIIVFDANICVEAVEYVVNNTNALTILDAVSGIKILKYKDKLSMFNIVKVNEQEASVIFEKDISNPTNIKNNMATINALKIQKLIITLGKYGVCFIENNKVKHIPAYPSTPINALGCGDSFVGGLLYGLANNNSLEKSCKYGIACSAITISVKTTTTKKITKETIEKIIGEEKCT